jgi:hypothetical protein
MENNNKTLQDFAVKNAVILSLVYIVLLLLLYLMGISYYGSFYKIFPFLIMLTGILMIGFRLRKLNSGFIEFKKALKYIYLIFVIVEISFSVFNAVMFKVVDPNMDKEIKQLAVQQTQSMMEKFNQPQDKIDEAVARVKASDTSFKYSTAFLGLGIWLIIDFLFALIFAAIVKKDKVFDDMSDVNAPNTN